MCIAVMKIHLPDNCDDAIFLDRKVGGKSREKGPALTLIGLSYRDILVFSNSHPLLFVRFIRS
jgi:hypothetical protein